MSQNVVLGCPNCATQFSAPVGQFLPDGRQVRCSKCQHVWFHAAPSRNRIDPVNAELPTAPARASAVVPPATSDHKVRGRKTERAAATRDDPAHDDPNHYGQAHDDHEADPSLRQKRVRRRRGGGFLTWLLWLIALLLLLAILAYVFRDPLRSAVPQAAPMLDKYTGTVDKTAQGLVGRTAERDPFKWQNIHYDIKEYDGDKEILVEADLINTGGKDMPAPRVRVRVVDSDREPLHASVIGPEDMSESIPAGASTRYFVRIPEPPADFDAVLLNIEKD